MKFAEINKLKSGDRLTWNDPDNGACSRTDVIKEVEIKGNVVCVTWHDDAVTECYARELDKPMTLKQAMRFALDKILSPFKESQLYEDYRDDEEDGFTDHDYAQMIECLEKAAKVV